MSAGAAKCTLSTLENVMKRKGRPTAPLARAARLRTLRAERDELAALVVELQIAFLVSWQNLTPDSARAVIKYLAARHCDARGALESLAA
jgi:hypothetical protein